MTLTMDVLILGGGIAGMTAAKTLSESGLQCALVEKTDRLGGHGAKWACMAGERCARCSVCMVEDERRSVMNDGSIEKLFGARVTALEGEQGAFKATVSPEGEGDVSEGRLKDAVTIEAKHIIVATGFKPFDPSELKGLGYGVFDNVVTLAELDEYLKYDELERFLPADMEKPRIAMIQCVGSRDKKSGRQYCSQYCCKGAIRMMHRLKHLRPDAEISDYYIDLQIMGKAFRNFHEEAKARFNFHQGTPSEIIKGDNEGEIGIVSQDETTGQPIRRDFDRAVLLIAQTPPVGVEAMAETLGIERNDYGYFKSEGYEGAFRTSRAGIWLAGTNAGGADIPLSRSTALAAAGQIIAQLKSR